MNEEDNKITVTMVDLYNTCQELKFRIERQDKLLYAILAAILGAGGKILLSNLGVQL